MATPVELTDLIGRERALRRLTDLLARPEVRHVTLTGPGGIGKTRLARRALELAAPEFADGTVAVDLAALSDPAQVPNAVAVALGLPLDGGREVFDRLVDHLTPQAMLILLDNYEHLLPAAGFVPRLLAACPEVVILVTSRERLGTSGELVEAVAPLSLPGDDANSEGVAASPAVQLFVARATAVRAGFALTPANAAAVATICRRLDGMPLAIELAAARIAHFSPALLAEHVGRLLPLLAGGSDRPERQRTMQAAIGWSYDLLDVDEQRMFARLAVCAGGFSLAAAVAVGGLTTGEGAPDHLGTMLALGSLVDKSLVRLEPGRDERDGLPATTEPAAGSGAGAGGARNGVEPEAAEAVRYRLLEPIREYGLSVLGRDGSEDDARQALADFLLAETARLRVAYRDSDPGRWVALLTPELDNVRATLGWLLDGDVARQRQGLTLANELSYYFMTQGLTAEGRRWLEQLTTALAEERSVDVAGALLILGNMSTNEPRQAKAYYERFWDLSRELDLRWGMVTGPLVLAGSLSEMGDDAGALQLLDKAHEANQAWPNEHNSVLILNGKGIARKRIGDLSEAKALLDESRSRAERIGDVDQVCFAITELGAVFRMQGRYQIARELLIWSLERLDVEKLQHLQIQTHCESGELGLATGNLEEARQHFRDALAIAGETGNLGYHTGAALAGLAEATGTVHAGARAAVTALGALEAWEQGQGFRLDQATRERWRRALARGRQHLDPEAFELALVRGRRLSLLDATSPLVEALVGLDEHADRAPARADQVSPQPTAGLTRQERRVLCLVAEGMSNQEIANQLSISLRTAANHVTNILGKLDAQNRTQAAAIASRLGLCLQNAP